MAAELKPLSTLPSSNQSYRIDFLGNIQRNPVSSSNHLIDVFISPLARSISSYRNISSSSAVDINSQQRFQISVGELFAFHPGCILKNGQVVSRPIWPNFSETLSISPETTQFIRAGEKVDIDGYSGFLIPPHLYKLGAGLGSNLLCVSRDDDPYSVLIPAMEMVRFYYCGSSKFNQALFSSQILNLDNFIDEKLATYSEEEKCIELELRRDFRDSDAEIIGRLFSSPQAYKEAKKIWGALVRFQHNRNINFLPLAVGFPFTGESSIRAFGIELPTPRRYRKKRFLVLSLLSCSFPLPFNKMILDRKNNADPGLYDDPRERESKPIAYPGSRRKPPNDHSQDRASDTGVNDPFSNPSGYLENEVILLETRRFPPVEITKVVKDHTTHRSGYGEPHQEGELDNQSTSDTTHAETDSRPVTIAPKEAVKAPSNPIAVEASFGAFKEICRLIVQNHSPKIHSIRFLSINMDESASGINVSVFPFASSFRKLTWAIFGRSPAGVIVRHALLAEVKSEFGTHYLLEIERRKSMDNEGVLRDKDNFAIYIFANRECVEISNSQHALLFQYLAETGFKGYRDTFSDLGLQVDARRHTRSTLRVCAKSIVEKISKMRPFNEQTDNH